MAAPLRIRARAAVVRALYALPKPVRRLMAGPPVRIDGQEQALDAQLIIRLKNLSGSDVFADPVEKSRTLYENLSLVIGCESPVPVAAREVIIPAEQGDIPATLYTPADLPEPSGLLVYYHGGGFSVGSRISHEPVARFLGKPRWCASAIGRVSTRARAPVPRCCTGRDCRVRICAPAGHRSGCRSRPHRGRGRQRRR